MALRRLEGQGKGRRLRVRDDPGSAPLRSADRASIDGARSAHVRSAPGAVAQARDIYRCGIARARGGRDPLARQRPDRCAPARTMPTIVEAALMGFQSVDAIFREERADAEDASQTRPDAARTTTAKRGASSSKTSPRDSACDSAAAKAAAGGNYRARRPDAPRQAAGLRRRRALNQLPLFEIPAPPDLPRRRVRSRARVSD